MRSALFMVLLLILSIPLLAAPVDHASTKESGIIPMNTEKEIPANLSESIYGEWVAIFKRPAIPLCLMASREASYMTGSQKAAPSKKLYRHGRFRKTRGCGRNKSGMH